MSSLRRAGWGLAVLLTIFAFVWGRYAANPAAIATPDAAILEQLKSASGDAVPTRLTRIASLQNERGGCQAMIVQSAPEGAPMVVAGVEEDDGDEEATHWPLPFASVAEKLEQPVLEPVSFHGTNAGLNYRFLLVPLEETGRRHLLLTAATEPPSWLSLHRLMYLVALCLAIGLLFGTDRER